MKVNEELIAYAEARILPRYDGYDAAHRQPHIRGVIDRSMAMAEHYDVNPDMVWCAAAYHDLGLCEGRETHHLVSGRMVREDEALRRWFDAGQIETIAQAVEDHRASSSHEPRSLYGLILSEADRDLSWRHVVTRTVQYGLAHYPDMDKEGHWSRMMEHLRTKYGPSGYIRLRLPDSPNVPLLEELRGYIADPLRLRPIFEEIYSEISN